MKTKKIMFIFVLAGALFIGNTAGLFAETESFSTTDEWNNRGSYRKTPREMRNNDQRGRRNEKPMANMREDREIRKPSGPPEFISSNSARPYAPDPTTINGEITKIVTNDDITELTVKEDGEEKKIILGPSDYIKDIGLNLDEGDEVKIDAVLSPHFEDKVYRADSVDVDDKNYEIRRPYGPPKWAGFSRFFRNSDDDTESTENDSSTAEPSKGFFQSLFQ